MGAHPARWMTSASCRRQDLVLVIHGTEVLVRVVSPSPGRRSGRRQQGRSHRAQWRALGDASPGHKSLAARGGAVFIFLRPMLFFRRDTPSVHADNGSDHDTISKNRKTADMLVARKKLMKGKTNDQHINR